MHALDTAYAAGVKTALDELAVDDPKKNTSGGGPLRALGKILALGAASHIGANAVAKGLKSTNFGKNMGAAAMASGMRRGLAGTQLEPGVARIAKTLIGPEALVGHNVGHAIGEHLAAVPAQHRDTVLKAIRHGVGENPRIRDAPYGSSIVGAIDKIIAEPNQGRIGEFFSTPIGAPQSALSHAGTAAVLGGTALAEPASLVHMGVNVARDQLSTSQLGQQFMKDQFAQGVQGVPLHPAAEFATDMLLSPKALDTRRLGAQLHQYAGDRGYSSLEPFIEKIIARAHGI